MNELEPRPLPESVDKERAARALERIQKFGNLLDSSIRLPGTDFKIGIDPLVGFIPGIGDALGALFSGYILLESWRAGVPPKALGRMATNVGLEFLVGLIPVLGDVFDFGYKANVRNARIAEDAIVRRHFPPEDELGETPLWRQPRPLLIVVALSVAMIFGSGVLVGSCVG